MSSLPTTHRWFTSALSEKVLQERILQLGVSGRTNVQDEGGQEFSERRVMEGTRPTNSYNTRESKLMHK